MLDLNNYRSKTEELYNVHKYISKKLISLYILFGLLQFIFLTSFIALAITSETDPKAISIILFLVLYLLTYLLIIPMVKTHNAFTNGNLSEYVYDIVARETGLTFERVVDKKAFNLFLKENSNLLGSSSASIYSCVDIYDENKQNVIAKYSFISITYSKYLSYNGYLIMIPKNNITEDVKIFSKNFKQYALSYKEDKENQNDISYVYYNKKQEYSYPSHLVNLHQEIDRFYNEELSKKMSVGLLAKNNYLGIMFANMPKVHPNLTFKHRMNDEYLEKLLNAIIKDMELIQNIYNKDLVNENI